MTVGANYRLAQTNEHRRVKAHGPTEVFFNNRLRLGNHPGHMERTNLEKKAVGLERPTLKRNANGCGGSWESIYVKGSKRATQTRLGRSPSVQLSSHELVLLLPHILLTTGPPARR